MYLCNTYLINSLINISIYATMMNTYIIRSIDKSQCNIWIWMISRFFPFQVSRNHYSVNYSQPHSANRLRLGPRRDDARLVTVGRMYGGSIATLNDRVEKWRNRGWSFTDFKTRRRASPDARCGTPRDLDTTEPAPWQTLLTAVDNQV